MGALSDIFVSKSARHMLTPQKLVATLIRFILISVLSLGVGEGGARLIGLAQGEKALPTHADHIGHTEIETIEHVDPQVPLCLCDCP